MRISDWSSDVCSSDLVDEQRYADAAPVAADLTKRSEVDLEKHRDDHQPDQYRHRQVDLGNFHRADGMKCARQKMAERDADDNAQRDPEGQVAFKDRKSTRLNSSN